MRRIARVRVVGVPELRVELPGQVEVGRVAAGARDLLLPVRADERLLPDWRQGALSLIGAILEA